MGKGRDLGLQLKAWLETGSPGLDHGPSLANRLIDLLGAEEGLRSPVRDLASQPLLLQALHQRGGAQRSAIQSLTQLLSRTYAPQVLAELLDLIEAATGLPATEKPQPVETDPWRPPQESSSARDSSGRHRSDRRGNPDPIPLLRGLRSLGPGLALAASAALVAAWAAGELDRWLFDGLNWGGGVVLVLLLALVQVLAIGPFRSWKRTATLGDDGVADPRLAWRWITAPWIHRRDAEAVVNAGILLVLLGPSPLPLSEVVLRYTLTALATMGLAVLAHRNQGSGREWSGASGVIGALIGLAATLSLLQWRPLEFSLGDLGIPAWVLLIVNGALQLGWQLPRRTSDDASQPLERLLSTQWFWGTGLGAGWGLVSWGSVQLGQLMHRAPAG